MLVNAFHTAQSKRLHASPKPPQPAPHGGYSTLCGKAVWNVTDVAFQPLQPNVCARCASEAQRAPA